MELFNSSESLSCRTCSLPVAKHGDCSWCSRIEVPISSFFTFGGRFAPGERERYEADGGTRH
jgi:hypothetical protein